MNPLLPGLAIAACFGLAMWGVTMVRDPSVAARFAGRIAEEQPSKRGWVARFYEYLSDRLAPRTMGLLSESKRNSIRRRIDAAGKSGGMTLEGYAGRKAVFTLMMGTVGLLFALDGNIIVFIALTVLGWVWIDIWLSGVARRRQDRIDRDLPDFLDILAVTVSAGVGFRPALARVSEALGGPLAEEIMTALRQMDLGFSRRQGFEAVRHRNESESLNQFIAALLQAEELGVPLADALGNLAGDMRRSFYQAARRKAARAAPRVSLIVSVLLLPGALILIVSAVILGTHVNWGDIIAG